MIVENGKTVGVGVHEVVDHGTRGRAAASPGTVDVLPENHSFSCVGEMRRHCHCSDERQHQNGALASSRSILFHVNPLFRHRLGGQWVDLPCPEVPADSVYQWYTKLRAHPQHENKRAIDPRVEVSVDPVKR